MQKLIVVFSLLCLGKLSLASEIKCYKEEYLQLRETIRPFFRIIDNTVRRKVMKLRVPVDCKTTKKIIIPRTLGEAMKLLDFMLPLDYKSTVVRESLKKNQVITNNDVYEYNEDDNLEEFLYGHWRLAEENNICEVVFDEKYFISCSPGCGFFAIERFFMEYMDKVQTVDGLINLD